MARDFDGNNDDITSSGNSSISGDDVFSMMCWFDTDTTGAFECQVHGGDPAQVLTNFAMMTNVAPGGSGTFGAGAGGISLECGGGNGARVAIGTITTATIYHFLITKTAGALNTTTDIWLDGTKQILGTSSTNTPNITNANVFVGEFKTDTNLYPHNGKLACAVVWNVKLTDNEIGALSRGVNPFPIRQSNKVVFYEIWGNQSPELDISQVVGNGTVNGTVKDPHPPIELLENYL